MSPSIEYRIGEVPAARQLSDLYGSQVGQPQAAAEDLEAAVRQSGWVATAWYEGRLVGLARVLTDGVFVAYFHELLVHPDFQHQGVGKELLDRYDQAFADFQRQVAVTEVDWAQHKLGKRGFRTEPAALSRVRSRAAGI